jgi:type IV secretory pathway component VirB8
MEHYINIQPKNIILTSNKISINILSIELNIRAISRVRFYSSDTKLLNSEEFVLDGEEYTNWHNDDYLIDYISSKYGIITL